MEQDEVDVIMEQAKRRSERWRKMKEQGLEEETIMASFDKPTTMEVFSWDGDIDTVMTPKDSIRYYKHFTCWHDVYGATNRACKSLGSGINYRHFQFDHVVQGKRQIGSTFKPFVYATAIDQLKLSPAIHSLDGYYCVEPAKFGAHDAWCPKTQGIDILAKEHSKNALANSVNTISARLIDKVGPRPVANLARNPGVSSPIPNVPAIALGTPDLSVYEMVGAYSAFANKGIYVAPVVVTRIEDKNGTVIFQAAPVTKDVLRKNPHM